MVIPDPPRSSCFPDPALSEEPVPLQPGYWPVALPSPAGAPAPAVLPLLWQFGPDATTVRPGKAHVRPDSGLERPDRLPVPV